MINENTLMMKVQLQKSDADGVKCYLTRWIPHTTAFIGRVVDLGIVDHFSPDWKIINIYSGAKYRGDICFGEL